MGGSAADWVSGIGSMLAVFVALGGYWWSDRQKLNSDAERRQSAVHQISFKLSTLASEAMMTKEELNEPGESPDASGSVDFFTIVGNFSPNVGYDESIVRDLTPDEQNLLMVLRENDFLMDFSEAIARNQAIRRALLEYKSKRDALMATLPPPEMINGQIASHFLTSEQKIELAPWVIQLGTLFISALKMTDKNVALLTKLSNSYHPMMSKHFPKLNIHKIELGG